jgi:hypothetical protein
MELALAAPDMAEKLPAMLPNPPFYRNLKLGYQRYLEIADRGDWQDIPGGPNLTLGMSDPRVPLIREHLAVTDGFEPVAVIDAERYDADLAEAIRGFQRRSGLAQDGVIGPNTLRALNHPLDDRLLTIRANLERMRWLYNDLPKDYLFVDVAAYRVHLLRNDEEVWSTPVVVGTFDAQTPMFRDEMEHIVFNPTWSVPVSIQKKMRCLQPLSGGRPSHRTARVGGRCQQLQALSDRAAGGTIECLGAGQVHVSERPCHLSARHPVQASVRPQCPRLQPRLHPCQRSADPGAAATEQAQLGSGADQSRCQSR